MIVGFLGLGIGDDVSSAFDNMCHDCVDNADSTITTKALHAYNQYIGVYTVCGHCGPIVQGSSMGLDSDLDLDHNLLSIPGLKAKTSLLRVLVKDLRSVCSDFKCIFDARGWITDRA
jgi:hypothetical protein